VIRNITWCRDRPAAGKRHNGSTLGPYPAIAGSSPALRYPWLIVSHQPPGLPPGIELEFPPSLPYASAEQNHSTLQTRKGDTMKNPLDSIWGTIISGLVLTLILYIFARNFLVVVG